MYKYINVKEHLGIKGDGVTDDTTAIQTAVTSITNKKLYFPAGTYIISSAIVFPYNTYNWTIEGDGNPTIFQFSKTDGSTCFNLDNAQHFRMKNFKVTGISSYQNCKGFYFNNANRWSMEDIEVFNCNTGVDMTLGYIGSIDNLFIRYCNQALYASSIATTNGKVNIENCYKGFDLAGTYNCVLDFLIEGDIRTSASTINGVMVSKVNCYFEDFQQTLKTAPDLTIGNTALVSNLELSFNTGQGEGIRKTFTVDPATDTFTSASHGIANDTAVHTWNTGGTLPSGLRIDTLYYVKNVSTHTFQLHRVQTSGTAINIGDSGTGTHTAETIYVGPYITLDNVDGCKITSSMGMGISEKYMTVTSNTKNIEISSYDHTNAAPQFSLLPYTPALLPIVNYFPDPFFEDGIPTLSNFNCTNAEELTIKPDFATRSLKVLTNSGITSGAGAIAYRTMTFANHPQFAELRGKKIGLMFWEYVPSTADFTQGANGYGPTVRIVASSGGVGEVGSEYTNALFYQNDWQPIVTELTVPSNANQFILYYYTLASSWHTTEASQVAYFVGPLVWIGGKSNANKVLNGYFSHHPSALSHKLLTNSPTFMKSTVALTQGSGASTATLTNAPAVGNPTKWIPIDDNGTTRYIPCW